MLSDVFGIFSALAGMDSFEIIESLRTPGVWLFGLLVICIGGCLIAWMFHSRPRISKHLERSIMVVSYLIIAAIIFVEVIRRFVFSVQAPWSTTLPPYLFLVMAWFGCAYNVRMRAHLSFSEVRAKLARGHQMIWLSIDALMWISFSLIVFVTSLRVVVNSAANFQILLGTDDVMQWWLLISVPISFLLIAARAFQNWAEDLVKFRTGQPLISQGAITGD